MTEQTALILRCLECGELWLPDDQERWRAYLDTDDEVVIYCPECAEREFGSSSREANEHAYVDFDDEDTRERLIESVREVLNLIAASAGDAEREELRRAAQRLMDRANAYGPGEAATAYVLTLYAFALISKTLIELLQLEFEEREGAIDRLDLIHILEKHTAAYIRKRQ